MTQSYAPPFPPSSSKGSGRHRRDAENQSRSLRPIHGTTGALNIGNFPAIHPWGGRQLFYCNRCGAMNGANTQHSPSKPRTTNAMNWRIMGEPTPIPRIYQIPTRDE